MEDGESGAETTGWTQENLRKLLASLKDTIPENKKTQTYIRGLKAVDWDKVAFPPFSVEECQEKWNSMMLKMRRYRSLPELLDEAEELFSDPLRHKNIHPEIPKLPVPPKRAYIVKKVSRYMKKHPGMPIGQITKMFSKKYDNLPDEKKDRYTRKYTHEVDEYHRRIKSFCVDNDLPLPRKSNSRKKSPEDGGEGCSKDEGLPKKPPQHGRALFFKEYTKADGFSFGTSFFKIMGECWKELSEKEKQNYNRRCEKMKSEYKAKLIKYLDRLDKDEKQRIIKENGIKIPKKTLDRYARQPGEPKMPPRSGFIYFHSEQLKHSSETLPRKDRMDQTKKQWHKLSKMEKKSYAKIIQENMRKYTEDLQKWFQTLTPGEQRSYLKKKPSKRQFIQKIMYIKNKTSNQPSDSEDEDVFSSEDGGDIVKIKAEEGEDEENGNVFEMYH